MEFRILGALEVRHDGLVVPISGVQQRKALAVLLLEEGRTVSMQRLIEALWAGEPPATARRQVRNIVAAVRRNLAEDDPIERSGDGYRLRTDATDWNDFRREVAEAKSAAGPVETGRLLRQALKRWRGPVLAGLDSELIATAALGMEEERLAAFEDLYEAELALGLHREVVGEVRSLAAEHPYRQRLSGHLMLALYRSGDCPAALRVYTELGERLADELGIEPDRLLRDLYVDILREDPGLDLSPVAPEAAQPKGAEQPDPAKAPEAHEEAPAKPATARPEAPPPVAGPTWQPSRAMARTIAIALVVCVIGLGASRDELSLHPAQENLGQTTASVEFGPVGDPLWTYPALESGSGVMMVDAGLLVLDRYNLRLEVDGEVVWSMYLDSQTIPKAYVIDGMIVLSSSYPSDQPWNTGVLSGIDVTTGRELWRRWDRWPVGTINGMVISVGCGRASNGETGVCLMEAVYPRTGYSQWTTGVGDRSVLLRSEIPYDSPWGGALPSDYVLVQSYSDTAEGKTDRLAVYEAETGEFVSEFDYAGVENAHVNGGLLILHKRSTFVTEGRCEARVATYDIRSAELRWERFIDTPADSADRCLPLPTLAGAQDLFPATLGQAASVVWARSGELQWTVPEPSAAQMLVADSIVTTGAAEGLAVWDVWSHEKRWTANEGELMWARGSTLWVLDREAADSDCGGVVGYSLETGDCVCLPGSLVFITDDVVVTADDGVWKAWRADPWA